MPRARSATGVASRMPHAPSAIGVGEMLIAGLGIMLMCRAVLEPLILGDAPASDDGNPLARLPFYGFYLVVTIASLRQMHAILSLLARNKGLVLLVGLAAASILWSTNPELSLRRVIAVIGTTWFGLYLASRFPQRVFLRLLSAVGVLMAVLSIATALLVPSIGLSRDTYAGAWQGVFVHKNLLGRAMLWLAVANIALLLDGDRKRLSRIAVIGLALAVMIKADSATPLISIALLPVVVIFVLSLRRARSGAIAVGTLAAAVLAAMTLLVVMDPRGMLLLLGRDVTLTGRTEIWQLAWDAISRRPLLGYGYNAFWGIGSSAGAEIRAIIGWDAPHAHNGWLELWLELGAVGVGLMIVILAGLAGRAISQYWRDRSSSAWPLLFLFTFLATNAVESQLVQYNTISWVLLVATLGWAVERRLALHAARSS